MGVTLRGGPLFRAVSQARNARAQARATPSGAHGVEGKRSAQRRGPGQSRAGARIGQVAARSLLAEWYTRAKARALRKQRVTGYT